MPIYARVTINDYLNTRISYTHIHMYSTLYTVQCTVHVYVCIQCTVYTCIYIHHVIYLHM